MTHASESFKANEEWERWLDERIVLEQKIEEEDEQLKRIQEAFKISSDKGESYLNEQGITKEEVMKKYRLKTDK